MLKPPGETKRASGPDDEQPIDELFGRLIDEGTDYARAEFELARAKLTAEGKEYVEGYRIPAVLIGAALLLAQAAVTVLAAAGFFALMSLIGSILAGILVGVITFGLAGGFVWLAMRMLKNRK
jgi:hypothetical protein